MQTYILFFILFCSQYSVASEKVILGLGEDTTLKALVNANVHLDHSRSLNVEDLGNHLKITGKKEGVTHLQVGSQDYFVSVLKREDKRQYDYLKTKVQNMRGLVVDEDQQKVSVGGKLLRMEDWIALSKTNYSDFEFAAELSSNLQEIAKTYFTDLMAQNKIEKSRVEFRDNVQILASNLNPQALQRLENLVRPYGIVVINDKNLLEVAPLVRVQITVAEVKKISLEKYGIKWPGSYQAQLLSDKISIDRRQLGLSIQALEESGNGRILASPTLLCRSGKEAEFLAGGEFPVKVTDNRHFEVLWKKYGVLLKIKPQADFGGRMSIAIETEVSTLDASHIVEGIPALLTNRIQSHFDLTKSRTIALSGLIKSEQAQNSEGLPLLSNIPILGSLFSSKEYQKNQTELIMFVTPEIVNEDSDPVPSAPEAI